MDAAMAPVARMVDAAGPNLPGNQGESKHMVAGVTPNDAVMKDGKLLEVLHDANQGEIEQAKLAVKRTTDSRVKAFAETMIADHTDADKQGAAIAKDEKLSLDDSTLATQVKTDGHTTIEKLKGLKGAAFDREYVSAQITAHHGVLGILHDAQPKVVNSRVRAFLDKVVPTIEHHYQMAKALQKQLG
jgi:putative membrane protein